MQWLILQILIYVGLWIKPWKRFGKLLVRLRSFAPANMTIQPSGNLAPINFETLEHDNKGSFVDYQIEFSNSVM